MNILSAHKWYRKQKNKLCPFYFSGPVFISLFITLFSFACMESQKRAVPEPQKVAFGQLFKIKEEISFSGTNEIPIVAPAKSITITNDKIYLPDRLGNKIVVYDRKSKNLNSFGRRGQGPGEFFHPVQVIISKTKKNIIVLDSGNNRIQIFDKSYNLTYSQGAPIQSQKMYARHQSDGLHYWYVGIAMHDGEANIITEQDIPENTVNHYFPVKPSEFRMASWVSDTDDDKNHRSGATGNLYIANIITPQIEVFNIDGEHIKTIHLSGSFAPSEAFTKRPNTAAEQQKQQKEFGKNPAQIMSLRLHENLIFLVVAGLDENGEFRLLLDVYDKTGNLLYFGIPAPGLLLYSDIKNLYFCEQGENGTATKITVKVAEVTELIQKAQSAL